MNYYRAITLLAIIILTSFYSGAVLSTTLIKCVHPDGRTEFSDKPCPSASSSSVVSPLSGNSRSQGQSWQTLPQKNDTVSNRNSQSTPSQPVTSSQAMSVFTAWHQALNNKDFVSFKKLQYSNIGGNANQRAEYVKGVFDKLVEKVPSTFKISEYKPPTIRQSSLVSIGCKNNIRVGGVFTVLLYDGTWQVLDNDWVAGWEEAEPANLPCSYEAGLSAKESKIQNKSPNLVNGLTAEDRLKSCDPNVAIAAAEEIVSNPANLKEPLQLFSSAFALFQNGRKDDGVFWFYAAQLRVRQQIILENGDRGQLLSIMLMTMGPYINNYAFQNISNLNQILDRVLEWDKKTTNPFREKARSQKLDKQINQVYAGFSELKTKLATDKPSMETAARQAAPEIEQSYAQMNSQRCRKGQPDPAYENQMIEKEWLQATNFVKSNKDVILEVGNIKGVGRESSKKKAGETLPSRYIVSVGGDKSAYAVIDVSRSSGNTQFTLACFTHLSLGMRDPFKDECKQ